ncbi:MAG: hypothetical protein LBK74_01020 [Treponema sp.]|nr:hypothetical protein [Treponema sp.]
MAYLQSGFVLSDDETLALEINADLVITSSILPIRLLLEVLRVFTRILGFKKKGFLVVSNKRVAEIYCQRFLWFFHTRKTVRNVRLYNIREVSYVRKGYFLCFFRHYHLYYDRPFVRVYSILKGRNEEEVRRAANTFFLAINKS